jgi:hypothetical protein
MTRKLELVLMPVGNAELVGKNERVLWASDDDDDFAERNHNELLTGADVESILDYLVSAGIITEAEADAVEVFEETDNESDEDVIEGEIEQD